ncbi:hypothetical protein HDA32_000466 [Spinactinospora alkalitolerans]|uniref:SGNH hydrolase-type esterase domain-containing protein n=1 Tax=Spinactinospora alkalitolerans TaxID=687207 RepID=A0A852TM60_9ACTN|nr:GDSL-type esterase/lipase family protein [Spinactinospora alkalitolerans]NYE45346.1 hypothetical protein [Spinactinospora alkalitolerans]
MPAPGHRGALPVLALVLTVLLSVALGTAAAPAAPPDGSGGAAALRVMPAGDSIVQGSSGDHTWRYHLWSHLERRAGEVDFVGPDDGLTDVTTLDPADAVHTYRDPDFDQDHNARWGMSLAEAKNTIGEQVAAHRPDLLLVCLGINDLGWFGTDPEALEGDLRAYVANARTGNPELGIALSKVLPTQRAADDAGFAARVADFNRRMDAVARELSTEESPVVAVDPPGGFVPEQDTWDGTHPNARGELKIAAAFADALASEFSVGDAYPRPLPEVEPGPRAVPELTAEEVRRGTVELTWTAVPGATEYQIWTRESGGTDWTMLPLPLDPGRTAYTASGPASGGTDYRVRAAKGWNAGPYSNVVSSPVPGGSLSPLVGYPFFLLTLPRRRRAAPAPEPRALEAADRDGESAAAPRASFRRS